MDEMHLRIAVSSATVEEEEEETPLSDSSRVWQQLGGTERTEFPVLMVANAWQHFLTTPGLFLETFPGLFNLASCLLVLFGKTMTFADLCFVQEQFGKLNAAFQHLHSLFFELDGKRSNQFHEYVRSPTSAMEKIESIDDPGVVFILWLSDAPSRKLQLTYKRSGCPGITQSITYVEEGFQLSENKQVWRTLTELVNDISPNATACPRDGAKAESSEDNLALDIASSFANADSFENKKGRPAMSTSESLLLQDLNRLDEEVVLQNIKQQPTTVSHLEELLRVGAEHFSAKKFDTAAETFLEIVYRVRRWEDEASNTDQVKHTVNANCTCRLCASVRYSACAYGNIGYVYFAKGEFEKAVDYFEQSLPILREIGLWKESPKVLTRLFDCAVQLQDKRRIRHYGIQKIGSTQRVEKRSTLLAQIDIKESAESLQVIKEELRVGCTFLSNTGRLAWSLAHFGSALEMARLHKPGGTARLLEAKALALIGGVCFSMARNCVALVHLEEALLLLRSGLCGEEGAVLQLHALECILHICKHAGWSNAAVKYKQELSSIKTMNQGL